MGRARKLLVWTLIAFAIYAIFRSPDQAADVARSGWDGIATGVFAVGQFFDALLTGA